MGRFHCKCQNQDQIKLQAFVGEEILCEVVEGHSCPDCLLTGISSWRFIPAWTCIRHIFLYDPETD